MLSRSHNASLLVCDVVLHSSSLVDTELDSLVDWSTESLIILGSIDVIGIVLGVVDVIFGPVAAKSVSGNFEFLGMLV